MRSWKPTSLLVAGLIALAACTSTAGTSSEPTTPESTVPASESMAPMSPDASHDMDGEVAITSDAANLRTDLNYLLGEHLILAAKARAVLHGRYYVSCEDVRAVAPPVMRHRIITNFNAEAQGVKPDDIVRRLIELVPRDPAEKEEKTEKTA